MEEKKLETKAEKEQRIINEALLRQKEFVENLIIPKTNMIPAPNRIFVIGVTPDPPKTKSGIIIPVSFQAGYRENDQKTLMRFFCVALGDVVKTQTFNGEIMEPGDEVMYMDIPDAIRVEIPKVCDYDYFDKTGELVSYYMFDTMEIAGIVKRKEKRKEKS